VHFGFDMSASILIVINMGSEIGLFFSLRASCGFSLTFCLV
jgi:hypothetical protein